MNALCRPVLRTAVARNVPLLYRRPPSIAPIARRPTFLGLKPATVHARFVASSVSNRPASQTLEHAATNVKEELGHSASDLAKVIAGANVTTDAVKDSSDQTFVGITTKIASQVPEPIFALGLVGGVPYILTSATTVYLARQAQQCLAGIVTDIDPGIALTLLDQSLYLQVQYGAVMLSFLGAMHWGMEIAGYGGQKGYPRLVLGSAPMILAWTTLGMDPMTALAAQWAGFSAVWYLDSKVTMAGWTPMWYSQYRFYLSILVGSCIILSLAGINYYGPVAGHGWLSHEIDELREERKKAIHPSYGMIEGPIEAVPAGEASDHFTRIHKREVKNENTDKNQSQSQSQTQ